MDIDKMNEEREEENKKLIREIESKKERQLQELKHKPKKMIQPVNIDEMNKYKNDTVHFIKQCKKRKFIRDYFILINSGHFTKYHHRRPYLTDFALIIMPSIPENEERRLLPIINYLEFQTSTSTSTSSLNFVEFSAASDSIIDAIYDFCKSVRDEIDINMEDM
jgi:hypothetical protein